MAEETKNILDEEVNEAEEMMEAVSPEEPADEEIVWTEETARIALEEAREAESRAYKGMNRGGMTSRQKGILELSKLEEEENPSQAVLDRKCSLILESYYLPRLLKDGQSFKLNKEFTRTEDPERDYIEAVVTLAGGKTRSIGYNYKTEEDGKNLILFEKTFDTIVLEPGEDEKYVLYDEDGETELMTYSIDELEKKISRGEIVKVEDSYYRKATNADGEIRAGETTMIVEDEGKANEKIIIGNNEQEKYSISKNGQLVKATTNDVTTVIVQTRNIDAPGPIFSSAEEARSAAAKEMKSDETNLKVDVRMEGSTVAEADFLPVYTTSVELTGLCKKIGKGVEDYDPEVSDEENLRKQLAKPINQYLEEKGFHVLDITCENITADVKENVGWINTMKTYQLTGGVVMVTYIKKYSAVVSIKQGFLGRSQGADERTILAQLPEGSVLLNPQDIDWKSSKPTVQYVLKVHATGTGSAMSVNEADEAATKDAIHEGQKIAVKGLNGGIASGIREAIAASGAGSTVANVRVRMDTAVISKNDMELVRKDPKYTYKATCDRMVSRTENKLVSVTSWNCKKLDYIPAKDPVLDKGIPTDDNYRKYIDMGDDLGILVFEKSDRNLRRYVDEVKNAQIQAGRSVALFEKTRLRLKEAQEIFDRIYDAAVESANAEAKEKSAVAEEPAVVEEAVVPAEFAVAEEPVVVEEAVVPAEFAVAEEPVVSAEPAGAEEPAASEEAAVGPETVTGGMSEAQEALMAIFGESSMDFGATEAPVDEEMPIVEEEPVVEEEPIVVEPAFEEAPVEEASVEAASVPQSEAQEALMAIFGESSTDFGATQTPVTEDLAPKTQNKKLDSIGGFSSFQFDKTADNSLDGIVFREERIVERAPYEGKQMDQIGGFADFKFDDETE